MAALHARILYFALASACLTIGIYSLKVPVTQDLKHLVPPEIVGWVTQSSSRPGRVKLSYSIFQGRSALRDIQDDNIYSLLRWVDGPCRTLVSALLLCHGLGDAAHEVLLGVNHDNQKEAEFAATHRGQTDWAEKHPLTQTDHLLHSIIHRCEGDAVGEGNLTGWENAKYWATEPKASRHVIYQALARLARKWAPACVAEGVVFLQESSEERSCMWDPVGFVDLCAETPNLPELSWLQETELQILLRHELIRCFCDTDRPITVERLLGDDLCTWKQRK